MVPDENLTHYAENVDLPALSLQLVQVVGTSTVTGEPAVFGMHIHIPRAALQAFAQRTRAAGLQEPGSFFSAKMQAYQIALPAAQFAREEVFESFNNFSTVWDTATSLVFLYPEVMNLNTEHGTEIINAIQSFPCAGSDPKCAPFLNTLAFQVASKWPATTSGGWATLVQQTDLDDKPVVDGQGRPVYRYELDDTIAATAGNVAQEILKGFIFDNTTFAGSNWHATEGITAVDQGSTAQANIEATGFNVQAQYPVGSTLHGVEFVGLQVVDQAKRTVQLQVKNEYLRFLTAFVQFFPPGADTENDAEALPVDNPQPLDTQRSQFVKMINTDGQVMGIPLIGDTIPTTNIEFSVPTEAAMARVLFGSLGLGGKAFCPEAVAGSGFTLAINLGLPTMLLALGVGGAPDASLLLGGVLSDVPLLTALIGQLIDAVVGENPAYRDGIFAASPTGALTGFLVGAGNVAIKTLLRFSPDIAAKVLGFVTAEDLLEAAPFLGPALQIISIIATAAALAQTISEVLLNPALFDNTLSLTMDTTVTINHDPNDFQFPARARQYKVTATYAKAVTRTATGAIAPGQVDPIAVTFTGVPSGGTVTIEIVLTTDDGWIVGHSLDPDTQQVGPVGPIVNTVAQASAISITIRELLIPLTANTQYLHDLKLEYQNGQHVWVQTPAPTATLVNLCNGQDNALCTLTGITVHTRTGMAGYGFEAGNLTSCGDGSRGSFHTIQNLFLGQDPDRAFKHLGCGFATPVGIVYDSLSRATGHHFFLQPRADGQGFDVRSVTLDDTTPFNLNQTLSWGRFTQDSDSLAVHPSGYVVGVNRQNHKMEILQLPNQPVDAATAPTAVPFGVMKSGFGTRAGLMNEPVAVAVSPKMGILVLEQGNRRVQAFDVAGNPVKQFSGQTTNMMPLRDEGAGVVYLDLGIESQGYLYVLSYVNNGQAVSDYRLDIYTPEGSFLTRTTGIAAARMAVDAFRNVYALNYETLANAPRIEPSLSQWVPSTPTT
jgi:hypothetical protein